MGGVICCKGDATVRLSPRGIRSRRSNATRGLMRAGLKMTQTTQELRSLATDLVDHETFGRRSSGTKARVGFHVAERLRPHLANLMGQGGFRALLARALVLASADAPWLSAVKVSTDGSLDGLDALPSHIGPAEFLEGTVAVLAELLGLLVALIGLDLATRLIGEIWPKLGSTISLARDSEVQSDKGK